MRRFDSLVARVARIEAMAEATEKPLVLASGISIDIGSAGMAQLLREIDGKTRGLPSQSIDQKWCSAC